MEFEQDFLISYAHLDDQALVEGEPGWVSRLHRLLEIRVGQLLGEKPKIWRDPKLQGNDFFADTILDRLPKVGALLSVLSPRYVQSEWCIRELKEFCRASERSGGMRVADKARIFKVVKTPVPLERHPAELQPLLGYEFYVRSILRPAGRASFLRPTGRRRSGRFSPSSTIWPTTSPSCWSCCARTGTARTPRRRLPKARSISPRRASTCARSARRSSAI